jgi:branched-chain amino acid transport system substrate-binding protein
MNEKKVPQLFMSSGANKFADPRHFPWTIEVDPEFGTGGLIGAGAVPSC